MAGDGKRSKHTWTKAEENVLVNALCSLADSGWKSDNGTFRPGYLQHLERMMEEKLPGCRLNQSTIECKVRSLKKRYTAVSEMLCQSGFGWNEEFKCVQVDREVFDVWVRSHPNAKGMWNKPFPYYDELSNVFGKDRATGQSSEPPIVMAENLFREMEDEIGLGPHDYPNPNNQQTETQLPQDAMDEEMAEISTGRASVPDKSTGRASVSVGPSTGSKRKRSSFQSEMIDIMRSAADMQSSHMTRLASWQTEKHELEFGRRKEVIDAIFAIDGLTDDDKCDVIDIIGTDIQKTDCFLGLPEEARKRYCLRLLSRTR